MNKLLMVKDGDQGKVERKKLSQWFFNITSFADDLLNDLNNLNGWPTKVKKQTGLANPMDVKLTSNIDQKKKIKIFTQDLIQFLG